MALARVTARVEDNRRWFVTTGISALTFFSSACPAIAEPDRLGFDQLYAGGGVRGLIPSDRLRELTGRSVVMRGFMAPPLKVESTFFVLTRQPMALCPFCQSDADWPTDIVVIYLKKQLQPVRADQTIEVSGRLDVGSWTDPETNFVSQIRLVDASFRSV